MAYKELKTRTVGGSEYVECPECNTVITTSKPVQLEMPYCSDCKMSVLDAAQKYCCWCGIKFDHHDETTIKRINSINL